MTEREFQAMLVDALDLNDKYVQSVNITTACGAITEIEVKMRANARQYEGIINVLRLAKFDTVEGDYVEPTF